MVLCWILCLFKNKYKYNIIAVHVDYGNRKESCKEADFVETWCNLYNIIFIKKTINYMTRENAMSSGKRKEYELYTRNFRYNLYKQVIENYNCPSIIYGQHDDDIRENVWSNIMDGRSILDLSVMYPVKENNGSIVWRPMLGCQKDDVYDIAKIIDIPYLKDTTPKWSNRGKLRKQIFPMLENLIGNKYQVNLNNIGKDSMEWSKFLYDQHINPFLENIQYCKHGVVIPYL